MSEQATKQITWRFYAFHWLPSLLALGVEGGLAFWMLVRQSPLQGVFYLHLALVALLAFWTWWMHQRQEDLKAPLLTLVLVSLLGPLGALAACLSLLSYSFFVRFSMSFADWLASLFPEVHKKESEELLKRILSGHDDLESKRRISFQDVFAFGTVNEKRTALTKIAKHYQRDFASALRMALRDKSNAIRVQAASVMAKLEQDFTLECMALEEKLHQDPGNLDRAIALAEQLDDYAYSGILDEERKKEFLERAAFYYEQVLQRTPEDLKRSLALGRIYINNWEAEPAAKILKRCLELDGYRSASIGLWYMEALFMLGDFKGVRETAQYFLDSPNLPENLQKVLKFWLQGQPSPAVTPSPEGSHGA